MMATFLSLFLPFWGRTFAQTQISIPISITPLKKDIVVSPGGKGEFSIIYGNPIKAKIHVVARLTDIRQTEDGKEFEYLELGSSPWSAVDWIKIQPKEFILAPGETQEIKGEVTVPKKIRRTEGRYAAVVVNVKGEEELEGPIGEAAGETILFISVLGRREAKPKVSITELKVFPASENEEYLQYGENVLVVAATVKNQVDLKRGKGIHVFAEGSLILRNEKGRRLKPPYRLGSPSRILPDSTSVFETVFRNPWPPGNYIAEAVIEYGGLRRARARVPFKIAAEMVEAAKIGRLVDFRVEPTILEEEAVSSRTSVFFTVQNQEEENIQIEVSTEPMEEVGPKFRCDEWIEIRRPEYEVRRKRNVRVRVRKPKEAEDGTRYSRIIFKASKEGEETIEEANLFISFGKLERSGEIDLEIGEENGQLFSRVSFRNTGNTHLYLSGGLKFLLKEKESPKFLGTVPLADKMVTFPEEIKEFLAPLSLPSGEYLVEATFSYDGKSVSAVKEFIVKEKGG